MEKLFGTFQQKTVEPMSFTYPIEHCKDATDVGDQIISELEMLEGEKPLYHTVFNLDDQFKCLCADGLAKRFTTNETFLRGMQEVLATPIPEAPDYKDAMEIRADIADETGFVEKYNYIDWAHLEFLNKDARFMQALSLYEMTSPVLSLALPVILLIIPFFIIRIQGHGISVSTYITVLKSVLARHSIGQIFTLGEAGWDKRIYAVVSLIFYALQVYYNIQACLKFISNFKSIHKKLFAVREYLSRTVESIDIMEPRWRSAGMESFAQELSEAKTRISEIVRIFSQISPCAPSFRKIGEVGHIMKCFYQLYKEPWVTATLEYALQYNSYHSALSAMSDHLANDRATACKFGKNTKLRKAYYPVHVGTAHVDNTIDLKRNIIITGPNAAGKTTVLKTALTNIILSQQFGCGFYSSCTLKPYTHMHCYVNIPDTSGRDSLFQAEARRCKQILDAVEDRSKTHLCVFDELFSGTNPHEAVASASAFLSHLNSLPNVSYVITTHFLKVCKTADDGKAAVNMSMDVGTEDGNFNYTYKLKAGISTVRGGLKVLNDLGYPKTIIDEAAVALEDEV